MIIEKSILPANLEWLQKRELVPQIDVASDDEIFQNLDFSNGQLFIKYGTHQIIWSSASQELSLKNIETLPTIGQMECVYIFGFDDGQYIRKILNHLPKSSILVCLEPMPEFFYKLCSTVDLTDILSHNRFQILLGQTPNPTNLDKLGSFVAKFQSRKELERPHPWIPEFIDVNPLKKLLQESILKLVKSKKAFNNFTELNRSQFLKNTITSLKCSDVDHLKQAIEGKPLMVVGMGPSLATQIKLLKTLQRKAFIAATDNSLKELLNNGIDPDLVFHLEWKNESTDLYQGVQIRKHTVLCYPQGTNSSLLDVWPSFKVGCPSEQFELIFPEFKPNQQWSPNLGTTEEDFALHFAVQCKASEIYLVGIDTCFPTNTYFHPNDSTLREVYQEANRFWTVERWDWGHVSHLPDRITLDGWDGKTVHSRKSLKETLELIDTLCDNLSSNHKIYSTNPDGAKCKATLATLDPLASYPNINKTLSPSQNCIDPNNVMFALNEKRIQIKDYFQRLKQVTEYLQPYINSTRDQLSHLDDLKMIFLQELKKFQAHFNNFKWLEDLLVFLDNSLITHNVSDYHNRSNFNNDNTLSYFANNFNNYINEVSRLEQILIDYFTKIETAFINE